MLIAIVTFIVGVLVGGGYVTKYGSPIELKSKSSSAMGVSCSELFRLRQETGKRGDMIIAGIYQNMYEGTCIIPSSGKGFLEEPEAD